MKSEPSLRTRIMDISLNLARIGNWTADNYQVKKPLINLFLKQTQNYLHDLKNQKISDALRPVLAQFQIAFDKLLQEKVAENNKEAWAEKALTWANILQHRAKLA